jgi:hypothetical protein
MVDAIEPFAMSARDAVGEIHAVTRSIGDRAFSSRLAQTADDGFAMLRDVARRFRMNRHVGACDTGYRCKIYGKDRRDAARA